MSESYSLEQLEYQLSVLQEDKRKTNEKMFQIMGGIKVLDHMISELKGNTPISNSGGVS